MIPRLAGCGPAADHNVYFTQDFYFQPILRASRHVGAIGLLGDDSFELLRRCGREKLLALFDLMARIADEFRGLNDLLEEAFAFEQWDLTQVVAVAIKQIESIICGRERFLERRGGVYRAEAPL